MNHNKCIVKLNKKVTLSKISTGTSVKKLQKKKLALLMSTELGKIETLQNKLFAENRQALLIVFQGMDSSGKDTAIKNIMGGVNPQGVNVCSFKHPSSFELEHDYLWRHTQKLPEHGQITIFNRSHYENVLISKVHPEIVLAEKLPGIINTNAIGNKFWKKRYNQIVDYEKNIVLNGTQILKFFLHLSKEEQRKRFLERINNKEKHWKFSSADITERKYWSNYQAAYQKAIEHTSTKVAPWYIIPADNKHQAHLLISKIIAEKLTEMNPQFPSIDLKEKELMKKAHKELQNKRIKKNNNGKRKSI